MSKKQLKKNKKFKEFLITTGWSIRLAFGLSKFHASMLFLSQILSQLGYVAYTFLIGYVINSITKAAASNSISEMYLAILLFTLLSTATTINFFLRNYSSRILSYKSRLELPLILAKKVDELGVDGIENPKNNDLLKRADQNIYQIQSFIERLSAFIAALISTFVVFFSIIYFAPIIATLLVSLSIVNFAITRRYTAKLWNINKKNTEKRRKAHYGLGSVQSQSDLPEVKIMGVTDFLLQKYYNLFWETQASEIRIVNKDFLFSATFSLLNVFLIVAALISISTDFIGSETILIGTVVTQFSLIRQFSGGLDEVFGRFANLYEQVIRIAEVKEFLSKEPLYKDGEQVVEFNEPPVIEFRNVSFKYPNSEKYIFRNFNLKIEKGEKVAIVGHNGAGKTTLVRLISRFYQVTEGEIFLNGININDIKIDSWYKSLGVLFQEFNQYGMLNVEENIAIGDITKDLDSKEVIKAAKSADAHSFIKEYDKGYKKVLSEQFKNGIRPSTGQWQKIAIARFFYRNAPVIVFDEPTAAIDAVAEYNIFNKIYNYFSKKTVLIISHRFSTVRNADRILVIENGNLIDSGSHEELMKKNGAYAEAFRLQAEGYAV